MAVSEIHWEITTKCNLNCHHCLNNCGNPRDDELPIKEALKAVKVMADLGCRKLMITGGEPLARQGLPIILKECYDRGISIQLLTNGVLIDPALAKQLSQIIEEIGVSLDGSTAEINDSIRGLGNFARICKSIKCLLGYMPVSVYFTASRANFNDMGKTINLAWSLGTSRVHISEIVMTGRAFENRKLFQLSEGQKSWLHQFAQNTTGNHLRPEENCDADLSTLYLTSNGFAFPCTEVALYRPSQTLGHVNQRGFIERLEDRKGNFANSSLLNCRYRIYAGNNLVFSLNNKAICPMVKGVKDGKNDQNV